MENNTNFQTFHQMGQAINDFVKQATGRDNVQNIDMEHITVAQNHYYQDVDVSGRVVSFHAGAAGLPLEKLVVQIEPVQDLHGYDHPWPAGGGKNKLNNQATSATNNGVTFTVNPDGSVSCSGTSTGTAVFRIYLPPLAIEEDIIVNGCPSGGNYSTGYSLFVGASGGASVTPSTSVDQGEGITIPAQYVNQIAQIQIIVRPNINMDGKVFYPMIRLASDTDASYAPYSNICPITGWTAVNVYRAGQNMEDATVFEITLSVEAGTVYGGTLDVVSGELVVDRAGVDMGSLTWTSLLTNPSWKCFTAQVSAKARGQENFICSHYPFGIVYMTETDFIISGNNQNSNIYIRDTRYIDAETFKTAMAGVQLVYKLTTPITYQLTPTEITTLLGVNNIWSDAGDIEVKFKDLKELY